MSMVEMTTVEKKLDASLNPDVSRALTISQQGRGIVFRNATEITEFAKMMALSKIGVRAHLRGNPGACLAIVVQAVEWEMSPYAVASKSYLVNDQIAFESQLIQAVILRRAPIVGRIKYDFIGTGQDRQVRAWATLRPEDGGDIVEITTPKLRDIKPQNSPLWKNDPDQQQCYYGGRALCRRHFPDVLLGAYDREELEGQLRSDGSYDAVPSDAAPRGIRNKFDALAGGDKPREEKVFTQTAEGEAATIDHDDGAAPANDDATDQFGPMLVDLIASFDAAEGLAELAGLLDAAGWLEDVPELVREKATAAYEEQRRRIEAQNAREAAEADPHAQLKTLARQKAGAGRAAYNRWKGGRSDDDLRILTPMADELAAIATDSDKAAGRG